ncbi:biotin--[acetyl-CoA-carboxylase] ligase [Persephonella atlantica]|uniref:Bifunctional ligase/repressor BirA n=1 Tax=Persephonella atlantica TaxID=2699429 RepID=A0ABS1GHC2_9AQUI|nr:biotin--[acetyl-CoA-carboxylase] ligase [Persephonella atlantica]MBK3332250.1 biotin--[acetyl-CoA-carboxylase] ligase [Persephonella atlantica]
MVIDAVDNFILESIKEKTISGDELSKRLNISRTAVWKRIKKLESLGYQIEKSSKGYRLKKRTDFLLYNEIQPYLNTERIGKNYLFFTEIDSTNLYAKRNELSDGTVIVAEYQTTGKGRRGRRWISNQKKGLYFTIVLKENIPVNEITVFSLIFPLSVKRAVEKLLKIDGLKIKWPNDIYINGKKCAGFLIETELEGNEVGRLIAGIGINVNQTEEELKTIDIPATSLYVETGCVVDRKSLLASILNEIENSINAFDKKSVLNEVEQSLLWKGENVIVIDENIEGLLVGLTDTGGIKILTDNGILETFVGDLTLRRVS